MADDDTKPDDEKSDDKPDTKPDDTKDDLGDAGKRALDNERKARAAAEKQAKEFEKRLKEIEDKDKTEAQKLADAKTESDKRAETAEAKALRLEVAFEKGLTPKQAKRLTGSTREELEADADELLEDFKPSDDKDRKPPTTRPRERLRGGGDPDDEPEETDPAKLAASIPIRY